ncbi:MAG: hypothetical protein A2W61_05695 [Deltaproteobacteria bacterium RIFCSPLOWO2_01_44_7]|nr:MAG: hypothetical protein A2712_02115 [Deltaproteobacteria bacterium RIFCSPHIGHO2_01_FULL_43_49]OGQ15080.1 MAG: hypothetical protein A3D22_03365 [Deltaproteobacteria bacterium RIFCSPHIGHO2_02_FULL_44_53]OGQ27300.1 MAG: hypothetical protein A3D98_02710 [Deltaproteobacteria bacterium RIFCSPHIGHO2_12_FULL_44_21]OGQ31597.1 MAG: hypothetical protein A2979_04525 [Deltaproteobacteria bacterium RIFCSPLOWO2_01_FULL_45_74]OGQ41497.1 MAG: hypothetical protein A2W61_05695 [Deltaproteobacteria bacterium 
MDNIKAEVRKFWDTHPMGGRWTSHRLKMTWRYEREPHIFDLINGEDFENKQVVEIGCGPGLDTTLIAIKGGEVTAIDLSGESLRQAKIGLDETGILERARLIQGDGEKFPFGNNVFDIAYSYGVLHHTPHPQKAVSEIYRVLRPGGKAIVMLYRKYALQQTVIFLIRQLSKILGADALLNLSHKILKIDPNAENPEHGTSLFELFKCPVLKSFSKREAKKMFGRFKDIEIDCYQTGFTRIPECLKRMSRFKTVLRLIDKKLEGRLGFYMVVKAQVPLSKDR